MTAAATEGVVLFLTEDKNDEADVEADVVGLVFVVGVLMIVVLEERRISRSDFDDVVLLLLLLFAVDGRRRRSRGFFD